MANLIEKLSLFEKKVKYHRKRINELNHEIKLTQERILEKNRKYPNGFCFNDRNGFLCRITGVNYHYYPQVGYDFTYLDNDEIIEDCRREIGIDNCIALYEQPKY